MDDLFEPRPAPQSQAGDLPRPQMPPAERSPAEPGGRRSGGARRLLGWVVVLVAVVGLAAGGLWWVNRGGDSGSKVETRIPAGPSVLPGEVPATVEASTAPAPSPTSP